MESFNALFSKLFANEKSRLSPVSSRTRLKSRVDPSQRMGPSPVPRQSTRHAPVQPIMGPAPVPRQSTRHAPVQPPSTRRQPRQSPVQQAGPSPVQKPSTARQPRQSPVQQAGPSPVLRPSTARQARQSPVQRTLLMRRQIQSPPVSPVQRMSPSSRHLLKLNHIVIASGAHGCLVEPVLKCKENTAVSGLIDNPLVNKVSKIFRDKKSWNYETNANLKIIKIKGYEKYFITALQSCTIDKNERKAYDKCRFPRDDYLHQIVMENAGKSVVEYISKVKQGKIEIREFLDILRQTLVCLDVLIKNRMVHLDAKLDNVAYDMTTKKVKLIDFGLTENFENSHYHIITANYLHYPIDIIISRVTHQITIAQNLNTVYHGNADENIYNIYQGIIKNYKPMLLHYNVIKKDKKEVKADINYLIGISEKLEEDENIAKIDIFALGISCIFITENNYILPTSGAVAERYGILVEKMVAFKFTERISVLDAIKEIDEIIKLL